MVASDSVRRAGGNGPPVALLVSWLMRFSMGLVAEEGGSSSSLHMARAHLISSSKPASTTQR